MLLPFCPETPSFDDKKSRGNRVFQRQINDAVEKVILLVPWLRRCGQILFITLGHWRISESFMSFYNNPYKKL